MDIGVFAAIDLKSHAFGVDDLPRVRRPALPAFFAPAALHFAKLLPELAHSGFVIVCTFLLSYSSQNCFALWVGW